MCKEFLEIVGNGQCSRGDNCSFRHDMTKRAKSSPSNPSPNSFMRQNERKTIENPKSQRQKSPVVERHDGLARITLEELAITHFVKNGTLQECLFYKTKSGCRFGEKCAFAHRQVDEQPTKRCKTNNDKKCCGYVEQGKLARKRICHRWMSRSTGETWEER